MTSHKTWGSCMWVEVATTKEVGEAATQTGKTVKWAWYNEILICRSSLMFSTSPEPTRMTHEVPLLQRISFAILA